MGVGLSSGGWCRLAHIVDIFLFLGCGGMVGDGFSSRGWFRLAGIVDFFLFPGCGDFPLFLVFDILLSLFLGAQGF